MKLLEGSFGDSDFSNHHISFAWKYFYELIFSKITYITIFIFQSVRTPSALFRGKCGIGQNMWEGAGLGVTNGVGYFVGGGC